MSDGDGDLPEDVQELLRERVTSLEQLESLLMLRNEQDEWWSPELVGARLNISLAAAGEALECLRQRHLLDVSRGGPAILFKYAPENHVLSETVGLLAKACQDARIEVLKFMSSNAVERVRASVIHTFADAFLLGRKKDG